MSTCIWVTQNHDIMQYQQQSFLLLSSGICKKKSPDLCFFPSKEGRLIMGGGGGGGGRAGRGGEGKRVGYRMLLSRTPLLK